MTESASKFVKGGISCKKITNYIRRFKTALIKAKLLRLLKDD